MINVGIIGGAGYTGGELIRILINHPKVNISFIHSNSNAGNFVSDIHTDLLGDTDLKFTHVIDENVDVVFLCVGHGDANKFLTNQSFSLKTKIIDLSQDFRLKAKANFKTDKFIYGLPEINKYKIISANYIANPGCFATCIQLALLPLAANGILNTEIHINATTGSTGAGQSLSATSHFSYRNNNLSIYKAFEHQHINEITETLLQADDQNPSQKFKLSFIPQRGNFTRGILASLYLTCHLSIDQVTDLFINYYANEPFVHISKSNIHLKQVINTNKCLIHVEKFDDKILITSIIDNLLKGASGQAVQNMNLMFGLPETEGLKLKPVAF